MSKGHLYIHFFAQIQLTFDIFSEELHACAKLAINLLVSFHCVRVDTVRTSFDMISLALEGMNDDGVILEADPTTCSPDGKKATQSDTSTINNINL